MQVFDYDDIQLIPNKCVVKSRKDCDTTVTFGNRKFKIPVIPANMATVIDQKLAEKLAANGYFYVMHRFQPERRAAFIENVQDKDLFASISVGVKPEEYDFVSQIAERGLKPEYITIDIADGYSDSVADMIKFIKEKMPETFVIAGNVGTPEGVRFLEDAGADATKVGIGPGKACITKLKTGFGTGGWQLAAVRYCAKAARKPIIADGGIRHDGDIAKSLRFGASMVMIGSMFAGHDETPGKKIKRDGKEYKEYFGSASQFQKGEYKNVEGKKLLVENKGSIFNTLNEMKENLQSSISYAGGNDISALKTVDYVVVKNSILNGD